MLHATLAAALAAATLTAVPENPVQEAREIIAGEIASRANVKREASMELCFAGLQVMLGGEQAVSMSMTGSGGRCGCPDGCSLATFKLKIAGLALRI